MLGYVGCGDKTGGQDAYVGCDVMGFVWGEGRGGRKGGRTFWGGEKLHVLPWLDVQPRVYRSHTSMLQPIAF
jgi:hypothetical protein